MKRKKHGSADIWCPYCGRKAVLRSATYVYGERCISPEKHLYVCSGYLKHCDAYVGVHEHNLMPLGTMADGELRHLRIEAHYALDAVWKRGYMTRKGAYVWLANKMNLREKDMHIGLFSYYCCQESIRICRELLVEREKKGGDYCRKMEHRTRHCAPAGIG